MAYHGSEKVFPYNEDERKGKQVERMFDSIAKAYDRLNHLLSLGLDKQWRKKSLSGLKQEAPQIVLDVATGTGDFALLLSKQLHPKQVIGVDISEEMMAIAREKTLRQGYADTISYEWQDSLSLTFDDNTFDAVTVAFGIRNFENIEKGITEMYRVLKPNGSLVILELTTPERFPMKQLFGIYSHTVIPVIGWLVSKEKNAYKYLPASIQVVPQGKVMVDILKKNGFVNVENRTFTFGICSLYIGKK